MTDLEQIAELTAETIEDATEEQKACYQKILEGAITTVEDFHSYEEDFDAEQMFRFATLLCGTFGRIANQLRWQAANALVESKVGTDPVEFKNSQPALVENEIVFVR